MTLINSIVTSYSYSLLKELDQSRKDPLTSQWNTFKYLIHHGRDSAFGYNSDFDHIENFEDYRKKIPVRSYDQFQPFIDRIRSGEDYVLWDQKVHWFAKSSGTSSDKSKYIPITPDNLYHCHYRGFRKMLASYLDTYPKSKLLQGKSLTLGGSVHLDELSHKGAHNGDLSAILLKNTPKIAEMFRVPKREVALFSDFDEKIEMICKECSHENVTNFSGVPSWNLIMLLRLLEYNKAKYITDIWPNIELFMHGGISFEPYREQFEAIIPSESMRYVENYNASEGYFAFQDIPSDKGMLLALNNGVFFEFIPLPLLSAVINGESDEVYTLEGVRKGVQYAVVVTTNSGLWRYLIGDCVEFSSLFPHRLIISGRTQLYINAFGEEMMINNAEKALSAACKECNVSVSDYTVAPIFMKDNHQGAHQWVIEFVENPLLDEMAIESFAEVLDSALCRQNSDYDAKRHETATMSRLVITPVPKGTFYNWMKSRSKVGGQNKVPRLCNDRHFVDELLSDI